jgi:hypothetical protein
MTLRLVASLAVKKEYRVHVREVPLVTAAPDGNERLAWYSFVE